MDATLLLVAALVALALAYSYWLVYRLGYSEGKVDGIEVMRTALRTWRATPREAGR